MCSGIGHQHMKLLDPHRHAFCAGRLRIGDRAVELEILLRAAQLSLQLADIARDL